MFKIERTVVMLSRELYISIALCIPYSSPALVLVVCT